MVPTHTRPTYDAFGWLVWGREVLHWNLNTDGAPSWKPLTFLFTFPYALAGRNPQMWLWVITSTAAALAGALLAGRIAFRLAGTVTRADVGAVRGAAFAFGGVLAISGYDELVLIGLSDPMVMALCLGAVEGHLAGERRLTFVLLVLASLGRPEAWVFAGLYALWAVAGGPSIRAFALSGIVLIPVTWFIVPALTSHSCLYARRPGAELSARDPRRQVHRRVRARRRLLRPADQADDRRRARARRRPSRARWLGVAGAALLWILIEIAFAIHGWSAVPRYLLEPGALLTAIGGAAFGRMSPTAHASRLGPGRRAWPGRRAGPGRDRAGGARRAHPLDAHPRAADPRRHRAVAHRRDPAHEPSSRDRAGGRGERDQVVRQPVAVLTYRSELAWTLAMNVGNVGFVPRRSIATHRPIVLFTAHGTGWRLRAIPRAAPT